MASQPAPRFQLSRLEDRHLQIASLKLQGETQRAIATMLGMSESHLSQIVNSDLFQAYMAELHAVGDAKVKAIRMRAVNAASSALTNVERIANDPDEPTNARLKANLAILEMAGARGDSEGNTPSVALQVNQIFQSGEMTPERARELLERTIDGYKADPTMKG